MPLDKVSKEKQILKLLKEARDMLVLASLSERVYTSN